MALSLNWASSKWPRQTLKEVRGRWKDLREHSVMPVVLNVRVKCLTHVVLFGGLMVPPRKWVLAAGCR